MKRPILWLALLMAACALFCWLRPGRRVQSLQSVEAIRAKPSEARGTFAPFDERMFLSESNLNAAEDLASGETGSGEESWAQTLRELGELTARDPEAALRQVEGLPVVEEREDALKHVCLQWAEQDPATALQIAWRYQLGKTGGLSEAITLERLAQQWAKVDLSAALAWIGEQPAGENDGRRDRVMKGIADAWAEQVPADAAGWVAVQISPGPVQFDAALTVLGQWAARDFTGAAGWAELFPDGGMREAARERLDRLSGGQSN